MTTITVRNQVIASINESIASGARQDRACAAISLSVRTLQRWQTDARHEVQRGNQRPERIQTPKNRLSVPECQQLLAVACQTNLPIYRPARSSRGWPIKAVIPPLNRAFIVC